MARFALLLILLFLYARVSKRLEKTIAIAAIIFTERCRLLWTARSFPPDRFPVIN
jgi:hypothetical protein